jgi:hypothetical protein
MQCRAGFSLPARTRFQAVAGGAVILLCGAQLCHSQIW